MITNKNFVSELSKLKPNSTFLTLHKYRNANGEVADYSIVFNMSYKSALERSIVILDKYKPKSDIEIVAKSELLHSYKSSVDNYKEEDTTDTYDNFVNKNGKVIKGIKRHKKTDTLHLYGLIVHKKVHMPGDAKDKVNHLPLTIAKNNLRSLCPVSNFRQFKLLSDQVDLISVQKKDLLPPTNS
jgi:hypothetical protein